MKSFFKYLVICMILLTAICSFAVLAEDAVFTLSASAPITSDSGVSVITPSLKINGTSITVFDDIRYSVSSVCAKPVTNTNGTLSLYGRVNGSVTVGASFTYGSKTYTATPVTITVSGQYDRISAKKIKVVVFGNSITTHNTLDDWTSQGQGMAADTFSQDYAHIFTSQLEKKYGKGNVSLAIKSSVDFERAMDTATTTTNWTSFLAEKTSYVEAEQPDIIVLQMGENSFASSTPSNWVNVYRNGMEQFVTIMRESAPNATILLVSSTWGSTVNGVITAAEKLDVPYVRSDIIYKMEGSKAGDDNYHGTNGGIAAHPGNLGHERMGLAAYESISYYLTNNIDADIPYSAYPEAIEISGANTITTNGGSVKLTAKVLPEEAVQDVVWTTNDKRIATVNENGEAFAKINGNVTITATSAYDDTVKDTYTIKISGQTDPYTLTYNKNTTDMVTGMPEDDNYAKGATPLAGVYPERKAYTFLGWSLAPGGELIKEVNVTKNTTIYAIWEKATRWNFDRTDNIDVRDGLNFVDGFITNTFHAEVEDGKFTFMTTDPEGAGTLFYVNSPELDIDVKDYSALVIKQKNVAAKNSKLKLDIISSNGKHSFEKAVPDTNFNEYVFDLSSISGNITGFTLYPTNLDTTVYIESIEFILKEDGAVLNFEDSLYTGFSVDTEPVKAVSGTDYLIPTDKKVLLYNEDYSESALYNVTENGFEALDYYVVYDDMGYGSFALEESVADRANIFVAFYMPSGKIRKAISATPSSDGRVYFETPNVFETIYAKAFIFDANKVLKPISDAKILELYDVVYSAETDENGDTGIDMDELLNGNNGVTFPPDETVTIAGAVMFASKAYANYYNKTIPEAEDGDKWYTPYYDFAIENGIIEEGQFENPNENTKRHELASLLCSALPVSCFTKINDVERIIDVSENAPYAEDILTLYNAGVLESSDAYGSLKPESSITWEEANAVAERIKFPETRIEAELTEYSHYDAYLLDQTSSYEGKLPMASAWLLDGRGSAPKASRSDSNAIIVDIAEDSGTAYIREFNKFSTGRVVLDTSIDVIGEGAYLEYRNADDKPIYHLENTNDAWMLLDKDGSLNKVYDMGGKTKFAFRIIIDLDNALCTTYIDGNDCGTYPLCVDKEDANILNFRFATTDEGTPIVTPGKTFATVNYAVYEGFDSDPFYFTLSEGAERNTQNSSLNLAGNASASVNFIPTGVKIVAEFAMFLPKNESVCYTLYDGENAVAKFTTDENNFYLNGEKVYESYYGNLWYRLRFELDSDTQKIRFKVNGNDAAVVPFNTAATSIDNLKVENLSDTPIQIDTVKVFRMIEHDDYVPAPVRPKGEEKYTVGINVCSLWQEGSHWGWGIVSGFGDREPVLGYYDEGSPETADWEIKYLVEHGVDFEAICWYPDKSDAPIKDPPYSAQLYDGIKNAKYSDEIKYCIIWEMANSNVPASLDAWKSYYVPYMIEYFFKDPRYMRVNNQALMASFGPEVLSGVLGKDGAREALDYLEKELEKIGYDGLYYVGNGGTSQLSDGFSKSGVDGAYSYNWGTNSYSLTLNKLMNLLWTQNKHGIDVFPTISVAFNEAPWAGKRYPIMSKADNLSLHKWMRDEFMPTNAKKPETKNLVWLSTWNEYGEGTYMMPVTDSEIGFRYLDVIREVYTDEGGNPSINILPTEKQKERINHLYPQYRKALTREYYDVSFEYESLLSNTVTVDGKTFDMTLSPYKTKEGVVLLPFDTAGTVIDSRLGMFYLWDRDKKELTLQTKDHTVIFTAGSTTAVFDGEEKELASPVELIDSLPAIPIEELCEYVGYEFHINENSEIEIITPRKAQVDAEIAAREPGKWEFNTIHDNEGWTSYNLSLNTSAGLLRGSVAGTDQNRHMINDGPFNIPLSNYSGVEVRIKHRYTADNPTAMCVYFTTDTDQTWGEDKNKYVTPASTDSGDEFVVYTFDFSKHEKWNGTLRGLRFNSFYAKSGTFEIDYIRLIPNETEINVGEILK